MPLLNNHNKEISCKIVYYGTSFGGKTTNLQFLHSQLSPAVRGEFISMSTQEDRTLFFDFMPIALGEVNGWKIRYSLYTVPGQVHYNISRKLILNGVDAIVFVADSEVSRKVDNMHSLENLADNLAGLGRNIQDLPMVIQYNKRDLPDIQPIEELRRQLNRRKLPEFESIASEGQGVFTTLRAISQSLFKHLNKLVD